MHSLHISRDNQSHSWIPHRPIQYLDDIDRGSHEIGRAMNTMDPRP